MKVSGALREIYCEEMRGRIEKLRLALALCAAVDPKARAAALYDAHLQAHTMKGTSEQLGYRDASRLAAAMSSSLELAREANQLARDAAANVERGCNAFLAWLESDLASTRPMVIATAAFTMDTGGSR